MKQLNILVVDDEKAIRQEIAEYLEAEEYNAYEASSPSECFECMKNKKIDIVILDIKLPETDGITVLQKLKEKYNNIEVIMITGHGDTDAVVQCFRNGAFDFFQKPFEIADLDLSIKRTSRYIQLASKLAKLEADYSLISKDLQKDIGNIIGRSDAMKSVIEMTMKAANASDTSVLITGDSGSGKELIARVLHFGSDRRRGVFIPINCSAIPDTLIESELFGHVKGAFSGAISDKAGQFEAAFGGTVFLDEIAEMPIGAQAKILRALEERKVRRVGDTREIPIDIRVVSATNKNISSMIAKGEFREDLYYRLNAFEIKIPSLRERREDIPLLVDYYTREYSTKLGKTIIGVEDSVYRIMETYDFPGNVRELRNLVERACIICDNNNLGENDFPSISKAPKEEAKEKGHNTSLATLNLEELEKNAIYTALSECEYNQSQASKLLGISKYALLRKLKKYDISIRKELD